MSFLEFSLEGSSGEPVKPKDYSEAVDLLLSPQEHSRLQEELLKRIRSRRVDLQALLAEMIQPQCFHNFQRENG